MNRLFIVFFLISTALPAAYAQPAMKLWYRQPANAAASDLADGWTSDSAWLNALPVGNGFIGGMVFGDVNQERIQLNEKSLWSGSPENDNNPEAGKYIPQIRALLFQGKFKEATELVDRTQICKGVGSGQGNGAKVPFGCYQTLGDLRIDFRNKGSFTHYYRDLDLATGIASVKYRQNGIDFRREIFASFPDRVIVIRLTSNKTRSLSFDLSLDRPERFSTAATANGLTMTGSLTDGRGGDRMKYKVTLQPLIKGGTISVSGDKLSVRDASEVTLLVTAATDYRLHYPDYKNAGFEQELDSISRNSANRSFAQLRARHLADFEPLMKRNSIELGGTDNAAIPTDSLIRKNAVTRKEAYLYALYYQYGRYLLLSSSRAGSLPSNLQGIWANKIQTPWNGDYHTDINVQMNYWPAEVANLSECQDQFIDFIRSLVQPATLTAKEQYGLPGWVIHPITNVWGYTAPGEQPGWGMHIAATAWVCEHLWDHFAFNNDTSYLRTVWPVLKSSCEFYLSWLVRDRVTGKLVSGPSTSPENSFITPAGDTAQTSMGPSHDQEVIHELFSNTLSAASVLRDPGQKSFVDSLAVARDNLAQPAIAADGRLMEWAHEYKEVEPHHRHTSHLYALYPGSEISLHATPELAAAAKKSLNARGDNGTGWSLAWKIAFWARLHDGDRALKLLNDLLHPVTMMGTENDGGGTYLNLFDAGPPFQIDGNFGATAGIAELLIQSHEGFLELLPALPALWKSGKAVGFRARGAFELDMTWKNNRLVSGKLLSRQGGPCKIRYRDKLVGVNTVAGKTYDLGPLLELKKSGAVR